jgi:hypothetical protein
VGFRDIYQSPNGSHFNGSFRSKRGPDEKERKSAAHERPMATNRAPDSRTLVPPDFWR